ncbi:MAG: sigma-54-dependent Fis family transcriptional regulator [Fibrobacteres bacterium]|nr:sigma-54-dependent Fis family transcriptional regulator [Fibrobacterota bacterium]
MSLILHQMDFNSLLAKAKFPFWATHSKSAYLLLNENGDIITFWERETFYYKNEVFAPIKMAGNVFNCFDVRGIQKLSTNIDVPYIFRARSDFFKAGTIPNFYTSLPICMLMVNPLDDGRFIGTVIMPELFPNIFSPMANAMIYIDTQSNLRGFNDGFYNYFKEQYPDPSELLGLPCGAFFTPTPIQLQNDFFSRFHGLNRDYSELIFRLDNLTDSANIIERDNKAYFTLTSDGLLWENQHNEGSYITFLHPIDIDAHDFRFETAFTPIKGEPPLVILGDRKGDSEYLDMKGYSWGVNYSGRRRAFLKRYTYPTVESDNTITPFTGRLNYSIEKRLTGLYWNVNNDEIIRYNDFELISNPKAYFSLYLRPGCSVMLHNAALYAEKRTLEYDRTDVTVRLTVPRPIYFMLSRFYNISLTGSYPDIHGYLLRDITRLQESLIKTQNSYQIEKREGERLRSLLTSRGDESSILLGECEELRTIRSKAEIIANSNATVLIQGETGSGKEVLAHYIHTRSLFSKGPFIKVDCSSLAPSLIESELFGHEKGSFTGALQSRKGKFEQAEGGTLFIDEINNLSAEVQAKLLNFLQDFNVTRVGGQRPIHLNLRIIIASNIPLDLLVQQGTFRQDLFFRINVITLKLPPLCERKDDLPLLCDHFIRQYNIQYGKQITGLTGDAYRKLHDYWWPGNIRELKNVLHHAVLFCDKNEIRADLISLKYSLEKNTHSIVQGQEKEKVPARGITKEKLMEYLRKNNGNIVKTATELSISRQTLYYHLKRYDINPDTHRI